MMDRFWWWGVKIRQCRPDIYTPPPPSIRRASLLSLPCSHHSCFHPRCMRLPSPSRELHCEGWVQQQQQQRQQPLLQDAASRRCLVPSKPQSNTAQHPAVGSGEGWGWGEREKWSALNCRSSQQNKAALTWAHLQARRIWMRAIDSFPHSWKKIHLSGLSLLASASTRSLIYFRNSRHVSRCWSWWWGGREGGAYAAIFLISRLHNVTKQEQDENYGFDTGVVLSAIPIHHCSPEPHKWSEKKKSPRHPDAMVTGLLCTITKCFI